MRLRQLYRQVRQPSRPRAADCSSKSPNLWLAKIFGVPVL